MSENYNITIAKNDYYILEINQEKNRAYLKLFGYWQNVYDLANYINDIEMGTKKMRDGFTILADLTQYTGASFELRSLHIEALRLSVRAGLKRAAEVFSNNQLLKLLFDDYSKESGANTMPFKDRAHAERWLDLY